MVKKFITTKDNPFNPFTEFDEWDNFDKEKGYNTCAYLARIAKTSEELTEVEEEEAIDSAIDEMLIFNLTNNYIKVTDKD